MLSGTGYAITQLAEKDAKTMLKVEGALEIETGYQPRLFRDIVLFLFLNSGVTCLKVAGAGWDTV